MSTGPGLDIDGLAVAYGRVEAVGDASIHVAPGQLVALIGANGAGKTTVLHTVIGVLKPVRGSVRFGGEEIGGLPSHQVVDRGVALVPEARQLFPRMTVRENLEVGFAHHMRRGPQRALFDQRFEQVCTYFPRIAERQQQLAGTMSGGEQQMVAIARALMSDPKMLMLDEPSLGLSPIMVEMLIDIILRLHASGLGLLLVEQNAQVALEISDHAYVMESGRTTLSGASRDLLGDARVRQAYLGL